MRALGAEEMEVGRAGRRAEAGMFHGGVRGCFWRAECPLVARCVPGSCSGGSRLLNMNL